MSACLMLNQRRETQSDVLTMWQTSPGKTSRFPTKYILLDSATTGSSPVMTMGSFVSIRLRGTQSTRAPQAFRQDMYFPWFRKSTPQGFLGDLVAFSSSFVTRLAKHFKQSR